MTATPEKINDSRPLPESGRDTKKRLLNAAERLFAERGFEGTSIRALAQAAGTSVSAAHYHFGSKEALLRATLHRRLEPVNRGRHAALDALEEDAGGAALGVEAILDAFLRPTLEARAASPDGPASYRQVAARLYSDPPDLVAALKRDFFGPINERFVGVLSRALPERPPHEIALAFQFVVGTMVHAISGNLGGPERDGAADSERGIPLDESLLRQMIAFAAAGMRAQTSNPSAPARGGDA